MESTKRLTLSVTRKTPELLCPAESTPHEFKILSDIDGQIFIRKYVKTINFYKKNPSMKGKDPVKIIREAIAKALVFYYPLAGRLLENTGRMLVVECTGQGVVFVEADTDATLQHFGDALYPPFPNSDKLTLDVPDNRGILGDIPLMFIQVTRLKCGGFIFSNNFNHTMCDGVGLSKFFFAVGELARGATFPSIRPVWDRHLLTSGIPHHDYDAGTGGTQVPMDQMVERSFFFTSAEISALRRSLPPHLQRCSKFEIVAGCAWRCQTIALCLKPEEEMKFIGVMDNRKNIKPPLLVGYYGNVLKLLVAVTTAGELSENPLHHAVELVWKAKREATPTTDEYLRSMADLMVIRDPLSLTAGNTYTVSNLTHVGFERMDVGWGTAAYGGVPRGSYWATGITQVAWYLGFLDGIVVPVCLPLESMKLFEKHLQVTRLKCGGFIISNSFNHTMCDGIGISQFLSAVGELARGASSPSIRPVWERHLLTAHQQPHVSFAHREYDVATGISGGIHAPHDQMVGFKQMDVGWGPAAYGGVSKGIYWASGNIQVAWYLGYKDGFVVPACLPIKSIKVFEKHLQVMMTTAPTPSSS